MVFGGLILGVALLALFCFIETKVKDPMFRLSLFRIRAFAAGNIASPARRDRPRRPAVHAGHLARRASGCRCTATTSPSPRCGRASTCCRSPPGSSSPGPISGTLSDRFGARPFATGGLLVAACCFTGLMLLPIDFPYWVFALLIFGNGIGSGLFASPNTAAIMSSVPAHHRGAASGMRSTFQNSGMSLSIGIFFSLLIAGLANTLPKTLTAGLTAQGVPLAHRDLDRPPAAGVHGVRRHARLQPGAEPAGADRAAAHAAAANVATLTGK